MRKALVVTALLIFGLALTPAASTQTRESFDCGDVIKKSIRLRNNLTNCAEDGLIVGASGITIDLDGQTIDGKGDGAGILNEKGYKDVVITDGTITGFESGVLIETVKDTANTIEELELTGNEIAIVLDGANLNEVIDNEISGNEEGIFVTGEENTIEDNEIFDEFPAIDLEGDDNVITGNEIDYAAAGPDDTSPSIAVAGDGNSVTENEILAGEVGINLEGDDNVIANNELEGGSGHGIVLEGKDNEVRENEVKEYQDFGIYLRDGSRNLISANEVEDGDDEGIVVKADETRIEANDVDDNGNDGIEVDADDVRIVDNDVTDNGFDDDKGYGILAKGENVEGARNRARGNANPKECNPAILCD